MPNVLKPSSEGAQVIARDQARTLQAEFIDRFQEGMAEIPRLWHPGERCRYPLEAQRRPCHFDQRDQLVDLMRTRGVRDPALLERMPLSPGCFLGAHKRGMLGGKTLKVVAAARALAPLEDYIAADEAQTPLGRAALDAAVADLGRRLPKGGARPFVYLGLFSVTGWEREVFDGPPEREDALLLLSQPDRHGGYELSFDHGAQAWKDLWQVYDPESETQRQRRLTEAVTGHADLAVAGGHVVLEDLREELGLAPAELERVAAAACADDPTLSVQEIAGRRIIKRARF